MLYDANFAAEMIEATRGVFECGNSYFLGAGGEVETS